MQWIEQLMTATALTAASPERQPHLYVRVLPVPHAHDRAVLCPGRDLQRILREPLTVDHQAVVPRCLEGVAQPLHADFVQSQPVSESLQSSLCKHFSIQKAC